MTGDLLNLAERCEQATGQSAAIDIAIYDAVGHQGVGTYPRYTASLDAAMTLVPEGWPSRCFGTNDDERAFAALAGNDAHMMAEDWDEFYVEADAATPALALCAAALRARAAMEGQGREG
jgi:hypothetical protein